MFRKNLAIWLSLLLILSLGWFILIQVKQKTAWESPLGLFGAKDFVAFWSAEQAFWSGLNPYDSGALLSYQREALGVENHVQAFINLPGALIIFLPLAPIGFKTARLLWLVLNIFFLLSSIYRLEKVLKLERRVSLAALPFLSLLSPPVLMNLWFGQLAIFLLFCLVCGLEKLIQKKDASAGFYFSLLTLKPHLFLIFGVCILLWAMRERRGLLIAWTSCFAALPLALALLFQARLFDWFLATRSFTADYETPTLAWLVRYLLSADKNHLVFWPLILVPMLGLAGASYIGLKKKLSLSFAPVFLTLSLIFSPYAWVYDFCLLLPLQLQLSSAVRADCTQLKLRKLSLIFITPVLIFIICADLDKMMRIQFWYPIYFLILAAFARPKEKTG